MGEAVRLRAVPSAAMKIDLWRKDGTRVKLVTHLVEIFVGRQEDIKPLVRDAMTKNRNLPYHAQMVIGRLSLKGTRTKDVLYKAVVDICLFQNDAEMARWV